MDIVEDLTNEKVAQVDLVYKKRKNREHARKTRLRRKLTVLGMQNHLKSLKKEVSK